MGALIPILITYAWIALSIYLLQFTDTDTLLNIWIVGLKFGAADAGLRSIIPMVGGCAGNADSLGIDVWGCCWANAAESSLIKDEG